VDESHLYALIRFKRIPYFALTCICLGIFYGFVYRLPQVTPTPTSPFPLWNWFIVSFGSYNSILSLYLGKETFIQMVDKINIRQYLQIIPAFYKILRVHGVDTYEGSVLFTLYNMDSLGNGVRITDIAANNCMQRTMVDKNIKKLIDKNLITFVAVTKRIHKYYLTENALMLCRSVIERIENYKGEPIYPLGLEGTYVERRTARAKKAIKKIADDHYIMREVLATAVEKGIITADSVDTDKLSKIKSKFD